MVETNEGWRPIKKRGPAFLFERVHNRIDKVAPTSTISFLISFLISPLTFFCLAYSIEPWDKQPGTLGYHSLHRRPR